MRLFIYGSLKRGYWNCEHYMKSEQYVGSAESAPGFRLFEHATGGYPLLVRDPVSALCIRGEIWEVAEKTVARLDDMEGAAGYERQPIALSDGSVVDAYVYVQSPPPHFKDCGCEWSPAVQNNK